MSFWAWGREDRFLLDLQGRAVGFHAVVSRLLRILLGHDHLTVAGTPTGHVLF